MKRELIFGLTNRFFTLNSIALMQLGHPASNRLQQMTLPVQFL